MTPLAPASTDAAALLRRMVEIPSLSGQESALAEFLVQHMAALGFESHIDAAGNALGILGTGPQEIVLLGHMDTVPGHPPVCVKDGKLYGRGSVDAKGPLAAFIMAAVRAQPLTGKRVIVIGATEEEAASSKGARYAATCFRPAYCIIGEPSDTRGITLGYKGRLVLALDAEATARHSAAREGGVLEQGVEFWNALRQWAEAYNTGKAMFDRLDPALREIVSRHDGLSESIHLKASVRIPIGLTPKGVQAEIERMQPESGRLAFWGGDPPFRAEKNTPLVRALLKALREAGADPVFKLKSGTSDMNVVGPVWNCPIVAYGPGDSSLDHTPDEHLDLADFERAVAVLSRTLTLL